jgi:cytochrome c biogenesis protein CcdA
MDAPTTFLLAPVWALWLGILTSISPCPMAGNIAAISFIGKRVESTRHVVLSGLAYTVGRIVAYMAIVIVIVAGVLSMESVSFWLAKYMNRVLGPLLILIGMFLLEMIRIPLPGLAPGERVRARVEKGGVAAAGLLGAILALSFCPVSAALFFGNLSLSVAHHSMVMFPALYGVGTALPVVLFAILIAAGAQSVGTAYSRLRQFEWWARRVTGVVFIAVGMFYSLRYIFGVI